VVVVTAAAPVVVRKHENSITLYHYYVDIFYFKVCGMAELQNWLVLRQVA
jgi:hypothetical protein